MSVELAASAFSKALGLNDKQVKLLLRTGWVLLVTANILWGLGWLAALGLVGPASAAEVNTLKGEVKSIQVQLLEQDIFDVRLRQCKADTVETRQFYFRKLQEKLTQYYEVTREKYDLPDCKEIS